MLTLFYSYFPPFIMKHLIASVSALATSVAFVLPLSFGNVDALCTPTNNGGWESYSLVRPDGHGVPQTLTFRSDIQSKFCRVATFN